MRIFLFKFFSIISALIATILILEVIIYFTSLDIRLLRSTLFYSPYYSASHMKSKDSHKMYTLKPNSSESYPTISPFEREGYPQALTIDVNSLGFRSPERSSDKVSHVYRIMVFGGSNTCGVSVLNEDTYPAKLEKKLNEISNTKFEVWNGGVTATVLSQKAAFARESIIKFKPDLVIIQDFINHGRRPFYTESLKLPPFFSDVNIDYFKKDPELFAENIPLMFSDFSFLKKNHYKLLEISGFYRIFQILINRIYIHKLIFPHHQTWDCRPRKEGVCPLISEKYSEYGERVSERELKRLASDFPKQKIFLFNPIYTHLCDKKERSGVPIFSLCVKRRSDKSNREYFEAHPPSYVYDYYAEKLALHILKNYVNK